jgi:hypothetical protein
MSMHRFLPLLFVSLLPAAVAAPVPRDVRPEFGSAGLLSRADLEKVRFDSRPVTVGEGKFDEPLRQVQDEPEEKADGGKPRPLTRYDLAVHMPWAAFREGDPVPAYFVLRNNRPRGLGLDARLALFGPEPTIWNSCDVRVRNAKTGEGVPVIGLAGWSCGGGALVTVPADGFYVVRGDLGRTHDRKPLPPGEYEVDWRYADTRAAAVRFAVETRDGPKPAAPRRRPAVHFYRLSPEFDREERPEKAGEPFVWRDSRLNSINAGEMASALAAGHGGVFVPDVHAIPAADKLVTATLEWNPHRDADRVVVTLRAVHPHKQVRFADVPQLHLQVEADADRLRERCLEESAKDGKQFTSEALVTPLSIEARLPADWRERVGVHGTARVAVLVTSGEIELPRGGLERARRDAGRKTDRDEPPVWSGVVRTAFVELQFPPAPPRPALPE